MTASDILAPFTNYELLSKTLKTAKDFLKDLIRVCEMLCNNSNYNSQSSENAINDYVRDMLKIKEYSEVMDQTRHGISSTGKDAGSVDILVSKDGKEIAIYEGLKLNSINTGYIDQHIQKAIINYNGLGTATFIVAYVSTSNLELFYDKYLEYIDDYNFEIEKINHLEDQTYPNASVRVASINLSRDGYAFPLYFVAVRID